MIPTVRPTTLLSEKMALLAMISCGLPALCRVGSLRICSLAVAAANHRMPAIVCKKSSNSNDDEAKRLLASLNAGMNTWNDFDDGSKKKAPSKNAAKQKTKRTGKDGKLYLRDGPKRPAAVTKLAKRRMSSSGAGAGDAAAAALADMSALKVRIEESRSGGPGKKTTIIRGLESLPREGARALLKELKTALASNGRVNGRGELELQGAHAEVCMLRLQSVGYGDVRLAGGAGAKAGGALAWNAPKEVRERASAQKQ